MNVMNGWLVEWLVKWLVEWWSVQVALDPCHVICNIGVDTW